MHLPSSAGPAARLRRMPPSSLVEVPRPHQTRRSCLAVVVARRTRPTPHRCLGRPRLRSQPPRRRMRRRPRLLLHLRVASPHPTRLRPTRPRCSAGLLTVQARRWCRLISLAPHRRRRRRRTCLVRQLASPPSHLRRHQPQVISLEALLVLCRKRLPQAISLVVAVARPHQPQAICSVAALVTRHRLRATSLVAAVLAQRRQPRVIYSAAVLAQRHQPRVIYSAVVLAKHHRLRATCSAVVPHHQPRAASSVAVLVAMCHQQQAICSVAARRPLHRATSLAVAATLLQPRPSLQLRPPEQWSSRLPPRRPRRRRGCRGGTSKGIRIGTTL